MSTPPRSPTALTPSRLLAEFKADGERLASVATAHGLTAPAPTCPGWTVGDVVTHTAAVYRRQAAVIRLGRRPAAGEWEEPPAGNASLDWFLAAHHAMLDELGGRKPASPAFTRWPRDPTVAFWYRRMAHETLVHRVDVEVACGDRTPVDAALAVDGIDEVLTVFLRDGWAGVPDDGWGDLRPEDGADRTVAVRAPDTASGAASGAAEWRCHIHVAGVDGVQVADVAGARGAPADATISGPPEQVLLWLWGRAPDDAVALEGDPGVLRAFRGRLRIATQ
ncbi:MAG: hypothetical protein QOK14_1686 [Frankiaceae bacterium]|nr:hypothetical protein [Frankiaceae bacterium]